MDQNVIKDNELKSLEATVAAIARWEVFNIAEVLELMLPTLACSSAENLEVPCEVLRVSSEQ